MSWVDAQDEDETTLSPDFLVTGNGPQFRYQDHEKAWSCCASFIDAHRTDDWAHNRREVEIDWEKQFAGYARQCFIAHPTRIFVYGLCITETRLRLYRYDRCGALHSEWMSYRQKNAHLLVRVLLLLSSSKAADLGFDETVVINEGGKHVFSMRKEDQPVRLTEVSLLWDNMSLFGRATKCWKVVDESNKKTYVLKQQFVDTQQVPEHELLEEVKGIKGVVKDRFLYRMIVEEHGQSIKYVTDVVLLLKALRDAITAHKEAYIDRGVLHRDISANNILYAKDPTNLREGKGYGNLIDFELSIKVNRTTSLCGQYFGTGTRLFHSISLLESEAESRDYHQGYLDDLQAFFWVLIWILIKMLPPIQCVPRMSTDIQQLKRLASFESSPLDAAERKGGWVSLCSEGRAFKFISHEWGPEILEFVGELGSCFHRHETAKSRNPFPSAAVPSVQPEYSTTEQEAPTPSDNYDEVLTLFDNVIKELGKSDSAIKGSNKRRRSSGQGDVERPQTPALRS
ncbi:hypothetical protein CVT24_010990 [Panaeolus cyanescens]|uniref:Protein kinase domain-containing protein n=1 Tax=Panaeolus cyanescens TaxID=181874 RepID=A0A409WDX9_9AGAR|nr:hypothetical protein CVT24_010990 [Panaeolus cyanescens]